MDFLNIAGKRIVIFGIANRRSVAFHIARVLRENKADLICSVFGPEQQKFVEKNFPGTPIFQCDVANEKSLYDTIEEIGEQFSPLYGVIHSVAFANYSAGIRPFHETVKKDFLEAMDISCFSFVSMARHFLPFMDPEGAMLTISISSTKMAAESYGYMAPVKAALDSSVCFLAKSLSETTRIRVNAVGASLLKTSASAGIPGYIEPYLFAEKATLRKKALKTEEVADTVAFLISPRASGINAQTIIIDAGMSTNFFDREIVKKAIK